MADEGNSPGNHLERLKSHLEWEIENFEKGKLRTWEDRGQGQINTTERSLEIAKERLAIVNETLRFLEGGEAR